MASITKQMPSELDYLVNTLRNPGPSITVQNILSYLYNYLPYVKHEHNLKIVLASFLNNPVCFGATAPSANENYLIIEVFKLIMEKKLKVSLPTLSIKKFYDVISKELQSFVKFDPARNSWKVLPIISGIYLSNDLRDQLMPNYIEYGWFFSNFDSAMHELFVRSFRLAFQESASIDLSLLSLALYDFSKNLKEYFECIDPRYALKRLVDLIYGKNGGAQSYRVFGKYDKGDSDSELEKLHAEVFQHPAAKHLNKLSLLLERLFQDLPYDEASFRVVLESVTLLLNFDREFNRFTESRKSLNAGTDHLRDGDIYEQRFWGLAKSILFSQIIIFQGIISRFMEGNTRTLVNFKTRKNPSRVENEYREICSSILHCLYYLNFVLTAIGQGGFDGYNFVYYVSIDIVLQNNTPRRFEYFSRLLMGNYEVNLHPQTMNIEYVAKSKALFVLGLWENYLQQSPDKDKDFIQYIYTLTLDLVKDNRLHDAMLIEAGHSVLLTYFSGMENNQKNLHDGLQYFELLTHHFPSRLSAHQLSVAVETLGKKIMTHAIVYENGFYNNSITEFLSFVYERCLNTGPGQPIKNSKVVLFNSGQPVSEIEASSTISQLKDSKDGTDIFHENKGEAPKDLKFVNPIFTSPDETPFQYTARELPNTSREGIMMAFMNVIPYLPLSGFIHWLNKIWGLVLSSNKEEQKFLIGKLWKVLSENLDYNRCQLAYDWWYERVKAPEANFGHNRSIFKL